MKMLSQLLVITLIATVVQHSLCENISVDSINRFGLEFLKNLVGTSNNNEENFVYSPVALSTGLALLIAGANGKTRDQLLDFTGFRGIYESETMHRQFKKLLDSYEENVEESDDDIDDITDADLAPKIRMVNRLYVENNMNPLDSYVKLAKDMYKCDVQQVDFLDKQLPQAINKWIEDATNGKITNVVDGFGPNSMMAMFSVMYLSAKWTQPFPHEKVQIAEFQNFNYNKSHVNMMYNEGYYYLGNHKEEGYKTIRLDYHGGAYMHIILPEVGVHVDDLLRQLDWSTLSKQFKLNRFTERPVPVRLSLPKFEYKNAIDLKAQLMLFRVKKVFTDADLSGMFREYAFVSKATHKSFIRVDEEGTDVAAVNYQQVKSRGIFMGQEFQVNRPFIYLIRKDEVTLFAGVVRHL